MTQPPDVRFVMEDRLPSLVAGELADSETAAHQVVVDIVQEESPPADLDGVALKSETPSTRVFDEDSLTWPPRAEGYAYDIAYGPETPEPPGALVGDVHWIPR